MVSMIIRGLFVILASFSTLQAQNLTFFNDILVTKQGDTLHNAWAGGFNNPQWSQADFNGDALPDLFVFDRSDESVSIFLAQKNDKKIVYRYQPNIIFPKLYYWALLRDVNCDGIADLITSDAGQNLIYYLGKTNNGILSFSSQYILVKYKFLEYEGGPVISTPPLYVPGSDISGFADMDFDGDMDVLVNNTDGTSVLYFRNYAVERFGRCDLLDLELVSLCWGHFSEIYNGTEYDVELNREPCKAEYKTSHTGGTLFPINLNGDTLMDCVMSDAGLNTMIAIFNGGTKKIAHITARDHKFPSSSEQVNIPYFPASFFLDVNGDRQPDLIASPNDQTTGEDIACAWYYENVSLTDTPVFKLRVKDFLINEMPDLGRGVTPVWWDYDKDGLPDLILAGRSHFISYNRSTANLSLYKNIGTKERPVLRWLTDSLLNFNGAGYRPLFLTPAFFDMDGDGDDDLFMGELTKGWVAFWENRTSVTDSMPQFIYRTRNYLNLPDMRLVESAPYFYDWDGDDDLDVLVGTGLGEIFFYRNTGTKSNPSFLLESEKLGKIKVTDDLSPYLGKAYPFVLDGNSDGQNELWVANASGRIYIYQMCENPTDSFPLLKILFEEKPLGRNLKASVVPKVQDSHIHLTFGTERGGVLWASMEALTFKADTSLCSKITPPPDTTTQRFSEFRCFPNPASDQVTVQIPEPGTLEWYNLLGQKVDVYTLNQPKNNISVTDLTLGVYVLRFQSEKRTRLEYLLIAR